MSTFRIYFTIFHHVNFSTIMVRGSPVHQRSFYLNFSSITFLSNRFVSDLEFIPWCIIDFNFKLNIIGNKCWHFCFFAISFWCKLWRTRFHTGSVDTLKIDCFWNNHTQLPSTWYIQLQSFQFNKLSIIHFQPEKMVVNVYIYYKYKMFLPYISHSESVSDYNMAMNGWVWWTNDNQSFYLSETYLRNVSITLIMLQNWSGRLF